MTIAIRPAEFVDLSYVAAWMRERDRRELSAIAATDDPLSIATLIWQCSRPPRGAALCACIDDQPVAAFGYAMKHPNVYDGWMFGTKRTMRVVPAITRFQRQLTNQLYKSGAQRLEVRALQENKIATSWLMGMGARFECVLPNYGRAGETFVQLAWTRDASATGKD